MEFSQNQISQKDYLKRYLSKDKSLKKKKKPKVSSSSHVKRSVIIDDDLGLPNVASIDDEEFNLDYLGDEAPQVAGIVDERPLEIRAKESHGSNKWKPVGEAEGEGVISSILERLTQPKDTTHKHEMNDKSYQGNGINASDSSKRNKKELPSKINNNSDSDFSPPRKEHKHSKKRRTSNSDLSPPRKKEKEVRTTNGSDSDLSPPRMKSTSVSAKQSDSDSDLSPPRIKDKVNKINRKEKWVSDAQIPISRNARKNRHSSDSDLSPTQKSKEVKKSKNDYMGSDSDMSPQRRNNYEGRNDKHNSGSIPLSSRSRKKKHGDKIRDSDISSPRRRNSYESRKGKQKDSGSISPAPHNRKKKHEHQSSDSDMSLPRHSKRDSMKNKRIDEYDERNRKHDHLYEKERGTKNYDRSRSRTYDNDERRLPHRRDRKKQQDSDSDLSPPRRNKSGKDKTRNDNKKRDYGGSSNSSRSALLNGEKKAVGSDSSDSDLSPPRKDRNNKSLQESKSRKMDKTLDGKKAGLQDAKNLKEELRKLKEAEDVAFSKLQASVSGQNASAVMRDRKTGKIRDIEKEKQELIEKSAKTIEREKKYEKWGKGLKQVEDAAERLSEVLHEMNKPFARYAGDDDLENMLKSREREGDPMLDYIRSKQAESISLDNTGKPKYQGHFMPNRFGIRPGHRWDGVDRSNGYEKSWFEHQNARKAIQEEAYKWSTSDM